MANHGATRDDLLTRLLRSNIHHRLHCRKELLFTLNRHVIHVIETTISRAFHSQLPNAAAQFLVPGKAENSPGAAHAPCAGRITAAASEVAPAASEVSEFMFALLVIVAKMEWR